MEQAAKATGLRINACKGFVSEILAEVEERTRDFERNLAAELEQHAQRLQAELASGFETRLEAVEARLRAAEENSAPLGLGGLGASPDAEVQHHEFVLAGERVEELRRRFDELDIDGLTRRVDMQAQAVDDLGQRLQAQHRDESFMAELSEARRGDRAVIAELVEVTRQLEQDQEVVRGELQAHRSLGTTLTDLREVVERQLGSLEIRAEVVLSTIAESRGSDQTASDEDIQVQIQALREQLLSISMRLSELAMGSDQSVLQQLAEEHRSDSDRCRSMIGSIEQNIERMALNAKAAIKQLDAKQARSEAVLSATQQQLREELAVLIEELNRSRIVVNSNRFPSLTGHYGHFFAAPPTGGSRPDSASSTVPSTPDHRGPQPSGQWGTSPIDLQSLSSVEARKDSNDADACVLM